MPCRINLKRQKLARLLLESRGHEKSCFVTTTYRDETVPVGISSDGVPVQILVPSDLKEFLVRLRTRCGHPFRYYAVGEYGAKSKRPHYHAIMFGMSPEELDHRNLLSETWAKGYVLGAECNLDTMAYVAHYCTKKMTVEGDERLDGRPPEFARMSLKPGLGAGAVKWLSKYYETQGGAMYLAEYGDVSRTFRFMGRIYPFDYYILQKLRAQVGVPQRSTTRELAGPPVEFTPEYEGAYKKKYEDDLLKSRAYHKKMLTKSHHGSL